MTRAKRGQEKMDVAESSADEDDVLVGRDLSLLSKYPRK
jgi:hypothetical protein